MRRKSVLARLRSPETVPEEPQKVLNVRQEASDTAPKMMRGALGCRMQEAIEEPLSVDNCCKQCMAAHFAVLKSVEFLDEGIGKIGEETGKADLSAKEKALIQFARKARTEPLKIAESDFQILRHMDVSNTEIIDVLGVMEVLTVYNKFLNSLQSAADFRL